MNRRHFTMTAGAMLMATVPANMALAQAYPNAPIELVVPFSPGGATDLVARLLADEMAERLGVPVKVTNLTGGQTLPAVEYVRASEPDGYTLLIDGQSQTSLLEIVVPDLAFPITDRSFITYTTFLPQVMFVASTSELTSLEDALAKIAADPASVSWGSLGGSSLSDVAFARLFRAAGVDADTTREIVLAGGSEVAVQVAGGHLDLGIVSPTSIKPYVESGQVRALAILGDDRSELFPDVPTAGELGHPDLVTIQWNGISGPTGLPDEVVTLWHETVQAILVDEEFVARLHAIGVAPYPSSAGRMLQDVTLESDSFRELLGSEPTQP